jgi:hypothetical protein
VKEDGCTVIAGLVLVNELQAGSMNGVNRYFKVDDRFSLRPLSTGVGTPVLVKGTPLFKLTTETLSEPSQRHSALLWLAVALLLAGTLVFLSGHPRLPWMFLAMAIQLGLLCAVFRRNDRQQLYGSIEAVIGLLGCVRRAGIIVVAFFADPADVFAEIPLLIHHGGDGDQKAADAVGAVGKLLFRIGGRFVSGIHTVKDAVEHIGLLFVLRLHHGAEMEHLGQAVSAVCGLLGGVGAAVIRIAHIVQDALNRLFDGHRVLCKSGNGADRCRQDQAQQQGKNSFFHQDIKSPFSFNLAVKLRNEA